MTNSGLNTDSRSFNTDIVGSQHFWYRHQIVRLSRGFIPESRPVTALFADNEKVVLTRALQLNPRLSYNRVWFTPGELR